MADTGTTATASPTTSRPKRKMLPQYKVILHNDSVNDALEIVNRLMRIAHLERTSAVEKMMEAHAQGISLILITYKEKAEFLSEQFASCVPAVTVTIEPN